jgi:hypothetical protein
MSAFQLQRAADPSASAPEAEVEATPERAGGTTRADVRGSSTLISEANVYFTLNVSVRAPCRPQSPRVLTNGELLRAGAERG